MDGNGMRRASVADLGAASRASDGSHPTAPALSGTTFAGRVATLACGLFLLLGSVVALLPVAASATTTGAISGTVTASAGGAALPGVCVDVFTSDGALTQVGSATTAADGTYTVSGLSVGSFDVEFSIDGCGSTGNFLSQWYNNAVSSASARTVPVTAGVTTGSINAALITAGTISGTVTAATGGADLSGICVDVTQIGGSGSGAATTLANGTYAVTGLRTGSYTVEFFANCGNTGNFLTQWYAGQASEGLANPVSVTNGLTTAAVNAALITGGTITGIVTAAAGGANLSGICVNASEISGTAFQSATTNASGSYTLSGLSTGDYTVEFSPDCGNSGNFLTQWYSGETSAGSADPVTVVAGTTTTPINAAMQLPGTITGTVTAATGGAPLSGICVNVTSAGGSGVGFAITGADGTYSVSGLESGGYEVEYSPGCGNSGNFLTQWYDNEDSAGTADVVAVIAGQTKPSINAALVTGGIISGTVTVAAGGGPASGICVDAFTSDGSLTPVGNATTGADGTYSIVGLNSGDYDVEFSAGCGGDGNFTTQWYSNQPSPTTANAVPVLAGSTGPPINAALLTSGTIAGTVTSATGGGALSGICVSIYTADNTLTLVGTTPTAADGTFSVDGLTTGSYDVEFTGGCGNPGNVGQQWYDNQISQNLATPVTVTTGVTTSIDAALAIGGTITGTVTATVGGAALGGICVDAYAAGAFDLPLASTLTSNDGTYTLNNLASGNYDVEFTAGCGSAGSFGQQWFDLKNSESQSTSVPVTTGSTTSSINASLAVGGTIDGTVTVPSGVSDFSGICVNAYAAGDFQLPAGTATTNTDGTYALTNLAPGSYDVEFTAGCGISENVGQQWYNSKLSQSASNPVAVTAGGTTSSINGTLSIGGAITGTVTAAAGGTDLSGICVVAFAPGDAQLAPASTTTASDGSYVLDNLSPGSYHVEFTAGCGASVSYSTQWFSGSSTEASANPVIVVSLLPTPLINAAMVLGSPSVAKISPASGPTAGGTSVTITGTNLAAATSVKFGTTAGTITGNSPSSVTATSPAGAVGTSDVTVTTPGGTSPTSSGDKFTYVGPPSVTGISPTNGPSSGGTSVTITGTNLSAATTVSFGTSAGTITADSATSITATAPNGTGGAVDVTVTTAGGTSSTSSADVFTYQPVPTVTGVNPAGGPVAGGTSVVISGANLSSASAVKFGTTTASVTADSAGSITATAPAEAAGSVDITVTTSGGTSVTSSADKFTYASLPTVTGVSPTSGPTSGGTVVTISGTNLAAALSVKFGTTNASVTTDTANSITATTPAEAAGVVDVTVTTPGGTSATSSADKFTYVVMPVVNGVNPTSGPIAGGTVVTIAGSNLSSATAVKFGTANAAITANSATSITATAPAQAAAIVDVTVATIGGTSATSSADKYTYAAIPTVTAVSPISGPTSGGTSVVITGTSLSAATTVNFGTSGGAITLNSATSITTTAPAELAGVVDISVTTPGGTSATSSADKFTYVPLPVVTGITPTSGPIAGGTSVTITGSNLASATSVKFGLLTAAVTADTSGSITATAPAESAGVVDVTVTTIGGTSATSSADKYTYAAIPTVTAISPISGPTSGGTSVVITGTNLSAATTVNFGTSAGTITPNSATSITATAPAEAAGVVDVTVTTPGGTSATSSADKFTYVALPVVTGISPTAGPIAGGTVVTIAGSNLSSATVKFGAVNATVTGNSATSITATAPAQAAGMVDVTVATIGGTSATSSADKYAYDAIPTVTAISPTSGPTSGGTSVVITGTNLSAATTVNFGTSTGTISADSVTSITATAPAELAGVVDISVTTPGGTSATSIADHYTFVATLPPTVSGVSPSTGSTAGGATVTVTGTNLLGATAVTFGTATAAVLTDSASTITATAPAQAAGTVDVTVTTPGGTSSTSAADHYTFVAPLHGGDPYTPLPPVRICDSRAVSNFVPANQCDSGPGNPIGPIGPGGRKTINVANSGNGGHGTFGVPLGATSVVLNVTVVNPSAPGGFMTVYPAGANQPNASNLNYPTGETVPNLVQVGVGAGGDISFTSSDLTDVIVDVEGYSAPGTGGGLYTALLAPLRLCDTRAASTFTPANQCDGPGSAAGTLLANVPKNITVTNGGSIPSGATAAVLNVTVVNPATGGFLTAYPQGTSAPNASNLNFGAGQTTTNRVIVPLSASGQISVVSSAPTDVIVDVSGYYSPGGSGADFSPETAPVRVCDTRPMSSFSPQNQCSGQHVASGSANELSLKVTGGVGITDGVPADATAVVVNLTGIGPSAPTFLTVFPGPALPNSSDLNPAAGETRANLVVATINPNTGKISVFNNTGSLDVIVDVLGWYS
jgi:hypothetical protein